MRKNEENKQILQPIKIPRLKEKTSAQVSDILKSIFKSIFVISEFEGLTVEWSS